MSFLSQHDKATNELNIDNIKANQEGRYTCRAENKAGRAEQDTYVEISGGELQKIGK